MFVVNVLKLLVWLFLTIKLEGRLNCFISSSSFVYVPHYQLRGHKSSKMQKTVNKKFHESISLHYAHTLLSLQPPIEIIIVPKGKCSKSPSTGKLKTSVASSFFYIQGLSLLLFDYLQ